MHRKIIDILKQNLDNDNIDKDLEDKAIEEVLLEANPEAFVGSQGEDK